MKSTAFGIIFFGFSLFFALGCLTGKRTATAINFYLVFFRFINWSGGERMGWRKKRRERRKR